MSDPLSDYAGNRGPAVDPFSPDAVYQDGLMGAITRAYHIRLEMAGRVEGPLRRYLAVAKDEAQEAIVVLASCDARDHVTIHSCQRKIAAFQHLISWLSEQIEDGDMAEESVRNADATNEEEED